MSTALAQTTPCMLQLTRSAWAPRIKLGVKAKGNVATKTTRRKYTVVYLAERPAPVGNNPTGIAVAHIVVVVVYFEVILRQRLSGSFSQVCLPG